VSIVLEKISKRFEGVAVVDDVSLEIADGELFVLLGASGSGKSTILRLIAGLVALDSGKILLHGRRVDDLAPQERGVGFVFQNYSLFRHMTVRENIEFGLRIRRVAAEERARRVSDLLEMIGLAGLGERYPEQLSGGQKQRVALARALAYQPAVLLLDEPFGALDVKIRGQLRASLKEIQRRLKVTTILVTHDQEEAFELGDRIGVMESGRLLEVAPPADLYRRPRTEYVATFVGAGNLVAGRVEGRDILLGRVRLALPPDLGPIANGAAVSVLCRPEEIQIARDASLLRGALLGRAEVVERVFAGSAERVYLRLPELRGARPIAPAPAFGAEETILQALVRPEGPGDPLPRPGDEVFVALRTFHVFARRGMRLLICSDGSPRSELAISFGLTLARALDGPVTLLGVAESADVARELQGWLEEMVRSFRDEPGRVVSVRTRVGEATAEIHAELEERPYDLALLGSSGAAGVGETATRVAEALKVPVLLVPSARASVARILICTAVGEPGKADIELGARIARRAAASVTILHVRPESGRRPEIVAAETSALERTLPPAPAAHLEKGLKTLGRLSVAGKVKIRYGNVVDEILGEAEAGDYDLIVIGAHGTGDRPRLRRGRGSVDFARAIIARAERPILLVPMQAA
jgi:sulfate transport system ATP-binding protein